MEGWAILLDSSAASAAIMIEARFVAAQEGPQEVVDAVSMILLTLSGGGKAEARAEEPGSSMVRVLRPGAIMSVV